VNVKASRNPMKNPLLLVFCAILLLPGTACSVVGERVDTDQDWAITVGMEATPVNSLIYIAEDRGFFADAGVELEIRDDYPSGSAAAEHMLEGEVDVATAAELLIVRMALEGKGFHTFGTIDEFEHQYLIARADRGIIELSDLEEKTVGVPMQTGAQFNFDRFLLLNGVDGGVVTLVDVQAPDAIDALATGEVDAVVVWQPNAATLKRTLGDNANVWPIQNQQPTFCALLTTDEWADEHPGATERLLEALARAEDFVASDPEGAKAIVQERLGYDRDYIDETWPEHVLSLSLDQSLVIAMEDQARWLIDSQLTEATEVPDFADYIDSRPLETVRPEAVGIVR